MSDVLINLKNVSRVRSEDKYQCIQVCKVPISSATWKLQRLFFCHRGNKNLTQIVDALGQLFEYHIHIEHRKKYLSTVMIFIIKLLNLRYVPRYNIFLAKSYSRM